MSKKIMGLLLGIGFIGVIVLSDVSGQRADSSYCAFCDEKVLNRQTFYEDDLVLALFTHKPTLPGHSLIIPKRHIERFELLSDDEISRIGLIIKKVNQATEKVFGTSSYLLLQKNGVEVGQTVPHVHVHYIPRKSGDSSFFKFIINMYLSNLKTPMKADEMQDLVERMKTEMKNLN